MNWVSSSLELAGSLLESVDQQAALTLAGAEEDEQDAELQIPSQTSEDNATTVADTDEYESLVGGEASLSTDGTSSTNSSHTATMANPVKITPPRSNSSNKLAGLVSAISTQLENVSSGRGGGPPLSSSGSQSASTDEECARLLKELTRVKNELRLKDKQLSSTQKSVEICEEELVALEQECKKKIAQVQQEKSFIQQEKNSDEQNFIQALEMKDNQVRALKADLDALIEAKAQYTDEITSLKAELAKAVESKDTLWTSAASASNESEQLIGSLRAELQDTLTAMNNVKREYAESKNTMFARQSQLESTNTELVNNVANLERELAKAKEAVAVASQTNGATTQENKRLTDQVNQLSSHSSATAAANGELRIQRLTSRLIEKQETIDSLRTRVTTMDVRLQDVTLQAQRAEEKLSRMEQNGGVDDMEMATPVGKMGKGGMRSRPNRMAHVISRVAPVVERSRRVLTALDVLDRWLLFLGRVFLQAPFARLGMLCYVVLIHFWVFMILSFHTSHLTEEMQLSTAAENAVIEPGEDMIPGGH
ncbi:hypothetical protein PInf_004074 [Phytophthora infestans]|nr:hypothetical protein PInf_004074 [Phytophthora infestans]